MASINRIEYASPTYFDSFYKALDGVANEKIYIEMINPPEFEKVCEFQSKLISNNWPVFYAIDGETVVGWVDITPSSNPRLSHRGFLGMGILTSHRRQGLGTQLLQAAIEHAKKIGLEKIELSVYSENLAAIALYKKVGFQKMGYIRNYRKLEGKYFDCIEMELFL